MFGGVYDKIAGLLDQRFILGLFMPVLASGAGVGALVATLVGWSVTLSWWGHLGGTRQALLGVACAVGLVLVATVLGTEVIPLTRVLEGYWGSNPPGRVMGAIGLRRQQRRRRQLEQSESLAAGLRLYQEFPADELQPTRLGNVLKAAESYSADPARWGLDAVFWWPRLYLVLPDSARQQVDTARATMDQMVVVTWLATLFGLVAAGFGVAGLALMVWLPCAIGSALVARMSYLAAVGAATSFGEVVRSCFDLYRKPLLTGLGWEIPPCWAEERRLWQALQTQLYRGEILIKSRRQGAAGPPSAKPESAD